MVDEQQDIYLSYLAQAKRCIAEIKRKWNREKSNKNISITYKTKTDMLPSSLFIREL